MYEKVFEQAESFFKPMTEIMALNAAVFDNIRVKQTELVNEVLADSIEYAKGLSQSDIDLDAFVETQQAFWDGLRSKITTNAQDNYDLLNDAQGKVGDLLHSAWNVSDFDIVEKPRPTPTPKKKTPVKKATPKVAKKVSAAKEES